MQPTLHLWNLSADALSLAGAQSIFNVVGRVVPHAEVQRLTYSLNDGPETAVAVQSVNTTSKRLVRAGDFNIDTISVAELRDTNRLQMRLYDRRGESVQIDRSFRVRFIDATEPRWTMDLRHAREVQEVGQVVDGYWQLGADLDGRRYIGITADGAGYDRVLLIGHQRWTTGYEIRARFRIDAWTPSISHGVGCAFKWNAHRRGDGSELPEEWSAGVAWAFSESPGLTVRYGVNATKDAQGRWLGESVMAEGTLSRLHAAASRLVRRLAPTTYAFPQIVAGVEYAYRFVVDRRRLALTIWDARAGEPQAQVVAGDPPEPLRRGSVGFIAHNCAVRVYDLTVSPLMPDGGGAS